MNDSVSRFFQDPYTEPELPGFVGVLYLLRRDVQMCLSAQPRIVIPATMALLAGIDLLSKFHAGDDSRGKVTARFKQFVEEYFHLSADDANVIYQLRNALLHSFGLYSKDNKGEYKFALVAKTASDPLVRPIAQRPDQYMVDALCLRRVFDDAVSEYRRRLLSDGTLMGNFEKMYPLYGQTGVGNQAAPILAPQS